MDEKQQFWASKERWPRDLQGYTFLARAVHRIGSVLFPDEWDGNEPVTPERYDLSWLHPSGFMRRTSQSEAKPWQIRNVRKLLRQPPPAGPFYRERLSDDDWTEGLSLAADADLRTEPARRRLKAAQQYLVQSLGAGRLQSVVWNKALVRLESVPMLQWAVEDVHQRFHRCAMNIQDPFSVKVGGTGFHRIFLANEGLDAVAQLNDVEANPFIIKKGGAIGVGLMGSGPVVPATVSQQDVGSSVDGNPPSASKARRGPKPKYDRAQFLKQVVEKLKDEGGLAPTNGSSFRQSQLEEFMRSWCATNWEDVPAESTIRDYVAAGIAQYKADNSGR